jgi:hypothetical protein
VLRRDNWTEPGPKALGPGSGIFNKMCLKVAPTPRPRGAIRTMLRDTIPTWIAAKNLLEDEDDDEYENDLPNDWRVLVDLTNAYLGGNFLAPLSRRVRTAHLTWV